MGAPSDWLRVRGIGRERFATYLADYLATLGYTVERAESTDPPESRLTARLVRQSPAVPESAREISVRFYPTSGGAAATWEGPRSVEGPDRARMDRLVREIVQHLERAVSTESHATAKVTRVPAGQVPWDATGGPTAPTSSARPQ